MKRSSNAETSFPVLAVCLINDHSCIQEEGVCVCGWLQSAETCSSLYMSFKCTSAVCQTFFQKSVSWFEIVICPTFSLTVTFLVEADSHTCVSCKPPTLEESCRSDPSCLHPEREERHNRQSEGAEREVRAPPDGGHWHKMLSKHRLVPKVADKTQMTQTGRRDDKAIEVI